MVLSMMDPPVNVSTVHKVVQMDFSEMVQHKEQIWDVFLQLKTVSADISAMV